MFTSRRERCYVKLYWNFHLYIFQVTPFLDASFERCCLHQHAGTLLSKAMFISISINYHSCSWCFFWTLLFTSMQERCYVKLCLFKFASIHCFKSLLFLMPLLNVVVHQQAGTLLCPSFHALLLFKQTRTPTTEKHTCIFVLFSRISKGIKKHIFE